MATWPANGDTDWNTKMLAYLAVEHETDGTHEVAITNGLLKAWVTFDGTGTILDSYNVSGVVRNATGKFTVSWDTDFADTNYCCVVSGEDASMNFVTSKATGSIHARFRDSGGTDINPTSGNVMAIGDQ